MGQFCCWAGPRPTCFRLVTQEFYCSLLIAQLGSFSNITNEVIVSGYELMVVICNYQIAR